jgi:hypothetical protein
MNWTTISSDTTLVSGNSYFCNGSSMIDVTLPSSSSQGDTITICATSDAGWKVVLSTGTIQFGSFLLDTTQGIQSGSIGDSVTLVYCADVQAWFTINYNGNIFRY